MKTLSFLISFLFFYSFSLFAMHQEKTYYNIYCYSMKLDQGELSTVYQSTEACFRSWVEYSHTKHFYYLKSEKFDLTFHIARITKNGNSNIEGFSEVRYLVAKKGNPHPFSISEIHSRDKFYIVITPIRFNHRSAIDEKGMVISTEDVCKIDLKSN